MASSSPAHLFKDKYSNTFISDVFLEIKELRGKKPQEMLSSGKISLQDLLSLDIPAKIQFRMD